MTTKQKKMLARILISFVLFVPLFICEHVGVLAAYEGGIVLFFVYFILKNCGYFVVKK